MFKINLVPEIQKNKNTLAKINSYSTLFGTIIVIATVSILVILLIITTAQKAMITRTDNRIKDVKEESAQYAELEKVVLSLENGLNKVKQILSGENDWTLLMPHMEAAMPKDARYGKITIEENGLITAEVIGKNIDALARFTESYKSYEVISISSTALPGETITISEGSAPITETPEKTESEVDADEDAKPKPSTSTKNIATLKVGPSGAWVRAIRIDTTQNKTFSIKNGESVDQVTYDATSKEITVSGAAKAEIGKLFMDLETTKYTKKDQQVTFDAVFKFESRLLW